ncbi:zinc finger BED domain-containing protein RICESLEEPER 3-like isoform X2 [Brassica napus]|uniref:zinc finger BED domain-containing protein RICESLEEPER 3-like isoform X2 n=1 Tax=Brassica napus TaxID=3708 RepID=UPI00207AD52E|nr:zinc finger BED domain-containing protein RICESLEEPER 3-like isoform X2 [Brassica napus]
MLLITLVCRRYSSIDIAATTNAYFLQVWKIECLLMKYASCDDPVMKEMAKKMRVKFSKYWDEYSLVLAMGVVLDPRLKLQILRTAYDEVDPRNAEKKVEVVKKKLKKLYEEYGAKFQSSSSTSSLEDDLNYDLFELERSIQPGLDNKKTNLEMYLEDPRLDSRSFTDIEILGYWKDQEQHYGDLASLACDLLIIPITTMASESEFSIGGQMISPYRNRLLPKNVQALLCIRNWLRGFAEFEGDVEDYFDEDNLDKDPTTTSCSSAI